MAKRTKVGTAHSDQNLGKPGEYSREQLDSVKRMIQEIADHTMGGMQNIVSRGDKVLIKINTVIPIDPNAGFTTDPRMLEALIELVQEQNPARIQIGERCAMGADTRHAMDVCGITEVARRTGVELCPFEHAQFDMYKIDRPVSFNEFPVPRPVREADVYIGLPKMKVHVHTTFTGAMKLQFGNLPDYDWMVRCHRDDIFQKIVNLTRAANPKWFVMDSLYACQGNGPFSPYSEDLIKDFNTICGGPDPVAVDTICEALMDWDYPGTNVPSTVLGAAEGLGTNKMDEIELGGPPIAQRETPLQAPQHDPARPVPQRQSHHGLNLRGRLQSDRPHPTRSTAGRWHSRQTHPAALRLHRFAVRRENHPSGWRRHHRRRLRQGHAGKIPGRQVLGQLRGIPELHPDLGQPSRRRHLPVRAGTAESP